MDSKEILAAVLKRCAKEDPDLLVQMCLEANGQMEMWHELIHNFNWIKSTERLPKYDMEAYDVTIECPEGVRIINVAIYKHLNNEWELMIDKHHFKDCKVVAWKQRSKPYEGSR